jgi:hypothetical protein
MIFKDAKYKQNSIINADKERLSQPVITVCDILRYCDSNLKKYFDNEYSHYYCS